MEFILWITMVVTTHSEICFICNNQNKAKRTRVRPPWSFQTCLWFELHSRYRQRHMRRSMTEHWCSYTPGSSALVGCCAHPWSVHAPSAQSRLKNQHSFLDLYPGLPQTQSWVGFSEAVCIFLTDAIIQCSLCLQSCARCSTCFGFLSCLICVLLVSIIHASIFLCPHIPTIWRQPSFPTLLLDCNMQRLLSIIHAFIRTRRWSEPLFLRSCSFW